MLIAFLIAIILIQSVGNVILGFFVHLHKADVLDVVNGFELRLKAAEQRAIDAARSVLKR